MRRQCLFALVMGVLAAGIASPLYTPAGLVEYLNLTASQCQPINSLDIAFHQRGFRHGRQARPARNHGDMFFERFESSEEG